MKIIKTMIIGTDGIIGSYLCRIFPYAIKFREKDLNITKKAVVLESIRRIRPDLVINTTSYTDIKAFKENQELAFQINGYGPGYIAEACDIIGATLIHFSTDCAFYSFIREDTELESQNQIIYRHSRLLGEKNIVENLKDYRIVKMPDYFDKYEEDFVNFGKNTFALSSIEKIKEFIKLRPGIYYINEEKAFHSQMFVSNISNKAIDLISTY